MPSVIMISFNTLIFPVRLDIPSESGYQQYTLIHKLDQEIKKPSESGYQQYIDTQIRSRNRN